MSVLAEVWNKWAAPENIVKAGKRVGITSKGLDIDWMDQQKFERAESILNPPTTPEKHQTVTVSSPVNYRKGSALYYKYKFEKCLELSQSLAKAPLSIDDVPGFSHSTESNQKDQSI